MDFDKTDTESAVQWATAAQIILILGGARSGKSSFAERLARQSGRRVAYIATATASDVEMRERIWQHRAERPADWYTFEEPLDLVKAVHLAAAQADVVVLDCMTVWLSNWLFMHSDERGLESEDGMVMQRHLSDAMLAVDDLLGAVAVLEPDKRVVVVSNEVGLGIVPAYPLGRFYRDALGRINQQLAAAAARVYLMVAGLGVDIKRLHDDAVL